MSLRDKYTDEEWEELKSTYSTTIPNKEKPILCGLKVSNEFERITKEETESLFISAVEKLIEGIERERLQVKPHVKEPYTKVKKILTI